MISLVITGRPGVIIRDGDRQSWDLCAPMIWDNFAIFRTNPLNMYVRVPQAMAQFVLKIETLSPLLAVAVPDYGLW